MNVNYNDATLEVRRLLSEAGHDIKCYSEYHTVVHDATDRYWDLSDDLYGKLDIQTSMRPNEFVTLLECMRTRTADKRTVVDEDGVGRSWCDACGRTVGQHYRHCPWCGAKFVG